MRKTELHFLEFIINKKLGHINSLENDIRSFNRKYPPILSLYITFSALVFVVLGFFWDQEVFINQLNKSVRMCLFIFLLGYFFLLIYSIGDIIDKMNFHIEYQDDISFTEFIGKNPSIDQIYELKLTNYQTEIENLKKNLENRKHSLNGIKIKFFLFSILSIISITLVFSLFEELLRF